MNIYVFQLEASSTTANNLPKAAWLQVMYGLLISFNLWALIGDRTLEFYLLQLAQCEPMYLFEFDALAP